MTEEESYAQALKALPDSKLFESLGMARHKHPAATREQRQAQAWAKVRAGLIEKEIERRGLTLPHWLK